VGPNELNLIHPQRILSGCGRADGGNEEETTHSSSIACQCFGLMPSMAKPLDTQIGVAFTDHAKIAGTRTRSGPPALCPDGQESEQLILPSSSGTLPEVWSSVIRQRNAEAGMGNIRLFVSHAHKDGDIAAALVDLVKTALVMTPGDDILCTSHQEHGYTSLDGMDVSMLLQTHLSQSSCVIALLTPRSIQSGWCLFELGGAWARATKTFPLLGGDITPDQLPAALKGAPCGRIEEAQDLRRLLTAVATQLDWREQDPQVSAELSAGFVARIDDAV
jgi:hypothetical protein